MISELVKCVPWVQSKTGTDTEALWWV